MPTENFTQDGLLTLAKWFSPSFPVGAFSYSNGLEWSVHTCDVKDAASFAIWLNALVQHGAGRNDLILLAEAYRSADAVETTEIDALARALSPSSERLLETSQQGTAFAHSVSAIWGLELPDLTFPVAVGVGARMRQIPLDPTAHLFQHAFAGNLTAAAIRLVPLGQTEGQNCLAKLTPLINSTADAALQQSLDDLGSCAFQIDIASMRHETQYSRMFRS